MSYEAGNLDERDFLGRAPESLGLPSFIFAMYVGPPVRSTRQVTQRVAPLPNNLSPDILCAGATPS